MTFKEILRLPRQNFMRAPYLVLLCLLVITLAAVYPSDMENDYAVSREGYNIPLVTAVEDYVRLVNTFLPIATALVLRDWTGMKQITVVAVSTFFATHISKRALNDVTIASTRLGERPSSPNSKHNMPSGHSSEAAAGALFMMRRYSKWFGIIVLPIMILAMHARYMLDAHTISATIAGALIGGLMVWLFTTLMVDFRNRYTQLLAKKRH